jgi:large subunit ribosomal protein L29
VPKAKPSRFRELTEPEAQQKLRELKEELFNLRFRHAVSPVDNPLRMRDARREIAMLETVIKEHQRGVRALAGGFSGGTEEKKSDE